MATHGGKQFKKNRDTVRELNLKKYGIYTCELCKKAPLVRNPPGIRPQTLRTVTIDHIKPLSKGGTHALTNLMVTCLECNLKKGNEY